MALTITDTVGGPDDAIEPMATGRRPVEPEVEDIQAALASAAAGLRSLWASALQRADFIETTRLVEAGHAVHRAQIALRPDSVVASRRPIPAQGGLKEQSLGRTLLP